MADIAKILRDGATKAISALGTVPKTISYYSVTIGSYNISTDSQTRTETLLSLTGVVYKTKIENNDKKPIELIQTKVVIAGQAFGAVKPKEDDYMVIETVKYEILSILPAPAEAAYVFVVRAV